MKETMNGYKQLREMTVPRWAKVLIDKLEAEHEAVKAEREALLADKARLDWLLKSDFATRAAVSSREQLDKWMNIGAAKGGSHG